MRTQVVDDPVDKGASLTHSFGSQSVFVQGTCVLQASFMSRGPCMLRLGWLRFSGAVVSLTRAAQQSTQKAKKAVLATSKCMTGRAAPAIDASAPLPALAAC